VNEEELLEQLKKIQVGDVILQTVVTLINLGGQRLTEEPKDMEQAKLAIEGARALLPLCPEEEARPIKDALSQLQMLFARESQPPPQPKAESRIWTPPGSTS
jgi:hypothetical protein